MRIIEICLSSSLGGLELYFEKCCLWFQKSPHHAFFFTKKNSRLESRFKSAKIPLTTMASASKWQSIFNAFKLAAFIKNNNIDIVHVHNKDDLLMAAITKLIGKKKFFLVHTRQMQIPHSKKDPWHKFIYEKIDLFITITEQLKKDAILHIPIDKQKIKKLYYGVKSPQNYKKDNTDLFFNTAENDQQKKFNIGIFSRLEYLKGQHLVIDAANKIQLKYPDIRYFFVGDSMNESYYQQLRNDVKKFNLQSKIIFKGFYPDPLEIMLGFDLIILPSYNETFGLVLAEAMRAEVAVIGTNSGGVTEIIEHQKTGLLFEKDNSDDLALQIELLYNDEKLRKLLSKNGKEKADKYFNEEDHFRNFEKLLQIEGAF